MGLNMRNLLDKALAGFGVVYILVLIGLVIGWVLNVVSILATLSDPITGLFIARLVGIVVFPLGGVLGFF